MYRIVPVGVWLVIILAQKNPDHHPDKSHLSLSKLSVRFVVSYLQYKKFSGGSKWNFSELSSESPVVLNTEQLRSPSKTQSELAGAFCTLKMEHQQCHVLPDSSASPEQSDPLTRARREHSKNTRKPEIQLLWSSSLCCRAAALPCAVWWAQV